MHKCLLFEFEKSFVLIRTEMEKTQHTHTHTTNKQIRMNGVDAGVDRSIDRLKSTTTKYEKKQQRKQEYILLQQNSAATENRGNRCVE